MKDTDNPLEIPPEDEPPRWLDLGELLCNPRLLEPPAEVAARVAYRGRITLCSGRYKEGKTTFASCVAAAVARGDYFLGAPVVQGRVAWLALDEPLGDTVRRFHDLGLTGGVSIATERPTVAEIHRLLLGLDCRLLVIDTLNAYASGLVEDTYRPEQWHPLFQDLRRAIHGTEAAVLVLHHLKKNAPEFTGSQAIGAGVDVLLGLTPSESDPTVRKVAFKGRVHGDDYAVRFDPVRFAYALDQGAASLDAQVLAVITREPGITTRDLRGRVIGRASDVTAALHGLERERYIENRGSKTGHQWHPRDRGAEILGNRSGTTSDPPSGTAGNHGGTTGNRSGTTSEPVAVPALTEVRGGEPRHRVRPEPGLEAAA